MLGIVKFSYYETNYNISFQNKYIIKQFCSLLPYLNNSKRFFEVLISADKYYVSMQCLDESILDWSEDVKVYLRNISKEHF